MTYTEKLLQAVKSSESLLCVGLDPDPSLMPETLRNAYKDPAELVEVFCSEAINATLPFCCAYKPNLAYFEALGGAGLMVFEKVLKMIPKDKIVIADVKRGDIDSTARQYKKAYFDQFNVDAVTLNPLMGFDTLDPFLNDRSKAVYTLVLTSNPGSYDLLKRRFEGKVSMAEHIAGQLNHKAEKALSHIGMVVGATHPASLREILEAYPSGSLLIPGVGTQGGDIGDLIPLLESHRGIPVITSSRSILYSSRPEKEWKSAIARRAGTMKNDLKPLSEKYA